MSRAFPSLAVLLTLLVLVAGCESPGGDHAEGPCRADPEVAAEIAAVIQHHVDGQLAGDPMAAAALYADDVWLMLDGGVQIQTREAMEDVYSQTYAATPILELAYTDQEVTVCGEAAHAVGYYLQTVDDDGTRVTTRAQYMGLWRRQDDGSWKLWRGAVIGVPLPD